MLLEYGETKEVYWTSDKFMQQIMKAVKIAEVKYPISGGYKHVWIFDHSSCHGSMTEDLWDVRKIKVSPGGKPLVCHARWFMEWKNS